MQFLGSFQLHAAVPHDHRPAAICWLGQIEIMQVNGEEETRVGSR
jgi:hypothetical protein